MEVRKTQDMKNNKVTTLLNPHFYNFSRVYIRLDPETGGYRLVVSNRNRVFFDKIYPTLRGAKIAFGKFFSSRSFRKQPGAQWSSAYVPEKKEWNM